MDGGVCVVYINLQAASFNGAPNVGNDFDRVVRKINHTPVSFITSKLHHILADFQNSFTQWPKAQQNLGY